MVVNCLHSSLCLFILANINTAAAATCSNKTITKCLNHNLKFESQIKIHSHLELDKSNMKFDTWNCNQ